MRPFPVSLRVWLLAAFGMIAICAATFAAVFTLYWQKDDTARTVAAGFGAEMAGLVVALNAGDRPLPPIGAGISWRIVTGNKFDEQTRRNWSDTLYRLTPKRHLNPVPYLVRVSLQTSALDAAIMPAGDSLADQLSYLSKRIAELSTPGAIRVQLANADWVEFTSPEFWTARPTVVELFLASLVGLLVLATLLSLASALITRHFSGIADFASSILNKKRPSVLPENVGPKEVRDISMALNLVNRDMDESITERTRFLAAISHDLRTPATRMQLRAELIEDDNIRLKLLSDLDEITTMISAAIGFMRDGLEQEEPEEILFLAFLDSICDDYIDVGKNVTFERPGPRVAKTSGTLFDPRTTEFDVKGTGQFTLTCQPNRLRRAINNLIDNALQYGDWARVRVSADAENIVIRINDGGPGLPLDQQQLVFAPFYRAEASRNRSSGGAGLGLSLAKSVVEAHGGTISLFNHDRCGLEVTFTLPRKA
jgi:signal transduction histidine kinase